MVSIRSTAAEAASPAARVRRRCAVAILVAACAAPGAVSTPHRRRQRGRHAAPPRRRAASRRQRAPRRRPDCGTDPVELNAYFETGFDLPFKLVRGVHQAVPERHLGHQARTSSRTS